MCFHHTDDCNEEDEKMLERVAESFFCEKQFWTDGDEDIIDFIEAYLFYDKDAEWFQYNDILRYKSKLIKLDVEAYLKFERLKNEIFNNLKVKFIPKN